MMVAGMLFRFCLAFNLRCRSVIHILMKNKVAGWQSEIFPDEVQFCDALYE